MTKDEVLEKLLNQIRKKTSLVSYNTMLKDIIIYSYENNEIVLTIKSNNDLLLQTIEKNYGPVIEEILNDITDDTCTIKYMQNKDIIKEEKTKQTIKKIEHEEFVNLEDDIYNYRYSSSFNELYTFDNFVVGESNKLAYETALTVAQNPGKLYTPFFLYSKSGL